MQPQTAGPATDVPAVRDDSELLQLAAPPVKDLLPSLQRVDVWQPLLVVLAMLPGLHALQSRELADADAAWGLRALTVVQATNPVDRILPGLYIGNVPHVCQPPLGTWLTAVSMASGKWAAPLSLVLPSYLAAGVLLLLMGFLTAQVADARTAIFAVVVLSLHGLHLRLVQIPAPVGLSLLLAVACMTIFLSHLRQCETTLSLRLLAAGISLGLCLLAGGLLAGGVVVVLLLTVLAGHRTTRGSRLRPAARRRGSTLRRLGSLGVLCLTAFAVGGWWPLIVMSERPGEFAATWFPQWVTSGEQPAALATPLTLFHRLMFPTGILTGLICCGVRCSLTRDRRRSAERSGFTTFPVGRHVLMSWLVTAAAGVLLVGDSLQAGRAGSGVWSAFWMLACVLAAARGVEGIVSREVGTGEALGWMAVTAVTLPLQAGGLFDNVPLPGPPGVLPAVLLVCLAAACSLWCWLMAPSRRELAARRVLPGILCLHLLGNAILGHKLVEQSDIDGRDLVHFHESLEGLRFAQNCRLVADREPPLRLKYVIRSVFPQAGSEHLPNWTAAVSDVLTHGRLPGPQQVVLVIWSQRDPRLATSQISGLEVLPGTPPQFLNGLQLRGYLLRLAR